MAPKGIPWEWELLCLLHGNRNRNENGLMGMGENENSTFSHFQSEDENQPISGATSASPGISADSDTLRCHSPPAKKRRVFATRRRSTAKPQLTGRICQPEWKWEREGMGINNENGKEWE